jgi:hypothetical protein
MKMRVVEYMPPQKQILAIPDHYVALGFRHEKATALVPGLAVLEGGRYIVKAGTVYPANDSTAIGIVLNDYDVTDTDWMMAVVLHGFVKVASLPQVPSDAAITALKMITFNPLISLGLSLDGTGVAVPVGAVTNPDPVTFTLKNAQFRTGVTTLANWTITGEATTKLTVASITVAADNQTVTFNMTQDAAAVAGTVTVLPNKDIINTGKTLTSAITIATVS